MRRKRKCQIKGRTCCIPANLALSPGSATVWPFDFGQVPWSLCVSISLSLKWRKQSDSRWLWSTIYVKHLTQCLAWKHLLLPGVIVKIKWEIPSVKHPDWLTVHAQKCLYFKQSYLFIYSFLAAWDLFCCARAFSSCGELGLLFVAVLGLPVAVASFILWSTGSRRVGFSRCGLCAELLCYTRLVASPHEESSRAGDWTLVPCIGRWILNHWT